MTLNFEKLREEIKNNSRIPDNGPGLEDNDKPYTIKIINEEQVEEDESDLDSSS